MRAIGMCLNCLCIVFIATAAAFLGWDALAISVVVVNAAFMFTAAVFYLKEKR